MGTEEGGVPASTLQRTVGRKAASLRIGSYVAADRDPVLRFRDQDMRLRYTLPH
jgi:hypothetical protein